MQKELIAIFGETNICTFDNDSAEGTLDELTEECPLPDIVVPPAVRDFLAEQEKQNQAANRVAFTTR